MVAVINPSKVSFRLLEPLSQQLSNCRLQPICTFYTSMRHYYKIEYIRKSENAWLLFARHMASGKNIVLKILCKYKDTRYQQEAVIVRQQCQIEALKWNRVLTPEIYIGLARICDFDIIRKTIVIDDIIENPPETLDLCSEYALVMQQLPKEWRLDLLLNKENLCSKSHYIRILTRSIIQIHKKTNPLPFDEAEKWGANVQLKRKLEHNLALADPVLNAFEDEQYSSYKLGENIVNSLKDTLFKVLPQGQNHLNYYRLKEKFCGLKDNLLQTIIVNPFQLYFEQRVQGQYIKRCHGDLKAPNIWIAPYESSLDTEPEKFVRILDTIDFNPSYYNIDVLSDLAMLVIDIQVRTKTSLFADLMIKEYLELTGQDDKVAKLVLSYYLVEKAYVGAAISFVYDNEPKLGWAFLNVAESRMHDLKCQIMGQYQLPVLFSLPDSSTPSLRTHSEHPKELLHEMSLDTPLV